jgi:hypothetical protein
LPGGDPQTGFEFGSAEYWTEGWKDHFIQNPAEVEFE